MRIAVTHPTAWPDVRRGSERLLHDLSHRLAACGHDVSVIASSPGSSQRREREGAVERILLPQRRPPRMIEGRWLNAFHLFGWDLATLLRTEPFDAVHCLNYHDAVGALAARRSGAKFRLVYQCTGIPVWRYFRRIPLDGLLFRSVVRGADAVVVLSQFARDTLMRDFGVAGHLLPSPTETTNFEAGKADRAPGPRILFSGDVDEPRKGALLLGKSFPIIAEHFPGARLTYCGKASAASRAAILDVLPGPLRTRVEFLGVGRVEDLPNLYASATVCVNPAVWEALGNVLIEALAAGVPVVGARHAGICDIVENEPVGYLFEPGSTRPAATNTVGLAEAVMRAVALAGRPETHERCRARARRFGWETLAPSYEDVITGGSRPTALSVPARALAGAAVR